MRLFETKTWGFRFPHTSWMVLTVSLYYMLVPFSVPDGFSEYTTISLSRTAIQPSPFVPNGSSEQRVRMKQCTSRVRQKDGFVFLTHIHTIIECDNQPLLYWWTSEHNQQAINTIDKTQQKSSHTNNAPFSRILGSSNLAWWHKPPKTLHANYEVT